MKRIKRSQPGLLGFRGFLCWYASSFAGWVLENGVMKTNLETWAHSRPNFLPGLSFHILPTFYQIIAWKDRKVAHTTPRKS
jgi:hypothetical protein